MHHRLELVWADGGYTGSLIEYCLATFALVLAIAKRNADMRGFVVLPKRWIVERRPDRSARRLLGKSDPLDAQAGARAVLSGRARARARAKSGDGPVHSARIFKLAKDSAVKAHTQAINQLKAVLVIADPALRGRLTSLGNAELFRTCARLGPPDDDGEEGRGGPGPPTALPVRSSTWSDRVPAPPRYRASTQGGGWTDVERAARERIRLQAMDHFERGGKNQEITASSAPGWSSRTKPGSR
ncbi:transposase [Streptomyces achromogenes]|uniref:hypothetical protein n=1 Tax=Streptomyces achromogenes TaxID=67255 RepID=UPI00278A62C1|nr:hypothetical protein [Streptomyces achromogenes]MDQ0834260.1 transposase [Streptomyces achromogenes]